MEINCDVCVLCTSGRFVNAELRCIMHMCYSGKVGHILFPFKHYYASLSCASSGKQVSGMEKGRTFLRAFSLCVNVNVHKKYKI